MFKPVQRVDVSPLFLLVFRAVRLPEVTRVELLAKKITELGYSCFFIHSRMYQALNSFCVRSAARVPCKTTQNY